MGDKFSFFSPKLSAARNGFIPEGLPHLCHIKKPGIVAKCRNNVDLCFEMTFSLPFPSSLPKLPLAFKAPLVLERVLLKFNFDAYVLLWGWILLT